MSQARNGDRRKNGSLFNETTDDHMHLKSDTENSSVLIVERYFGFNLFRDDGNE